MVMRIIEYKMHRNNNGNLIVPYFIDDCGYFEHNGKFIGLVDENSQCFVPTTSINGGELVEFTSSVDLVTRQQEIGMTINGEELSNEEIEEYITNWCDIKNTN